MITPVAAALYLAQHQFEWQGQPCAVFNPFDRPLEELPVIMCFNNGGPREWLSAVAIAEDGKVLGGHCCSSEGYMPHDLGVLEGSRPDRHAESYQVHYPDGYRMEFIPTHELEGHKKLRRAFTLHDAAKATASKTSDASE
jgi:hypothetical protein